MKSKKVAAILAIVFFSFSVSACSSNSNTEQARMTESATEESESIAEETETSKETETQKETETSKETQKETETTKESKDNKVESESTESKDNKASETSKASTSKEDSKPAATTTPQATETPKPTHTHSYNAVVTTQPTCTVPGIKTFTCSGCNDSYTESIPCIDHVFQDTYETIHHEAQGEMQQIQVGTSGEVHTCCYCNAEFGSASEFVNHCKSFVGTDNTHARSNSVISDGQPIYENQWIVTQEQYDEKIVTGQICMNCGLTR